VWRLLLEPPKEKAARRRLFNSNPMIVDQAAINAGRCIGLAYRDRYERRFTPEGIAADSICWRRCCRVSDCNLSILRSL
jgi:hypothetical protein